MNAHDIAAGLRGAPEAVHAAVLARHAAQVGLITATGSPRRDVAAVAALHPGLADLETVAPAWDTTPDGLDAVAEQVADHPYRPDGHLLGDLYQQISTEARKGRALCQTPPWVASLLLDISFDHAYREHGPHLRMIDPSCGTGHILMETLVRAYVRQDSGFGRACAPALSAFTPAVERIHAALDVVRGVDLDPYAVLVARYRLLVMARGLLRAHRHDPTPQELAGLPLHVAAADSLLSVDEPLLERGTYHVVVANPPYITVKDAKANAAIRARYPQVCNGKYSLALPFHALMTELLVPGGWCAQLTANSFMKREFGKRYVEEYLAGLDLTWVIDTSGAYIPGHGTPTVILVNRNQPPASAIVPTVMSVRGEPSQPADPARGVVWSEIAERVHARESAARFSAALRSASPQPDRPTVPARPAVAVSPAPEPSPSIQPTLFDFWEGAA